MGRVASSGGGEGAAAHFEDLLGVGEWQLLGGQLEKDDPEAPHVRFAVFLSGEHLWAHIRDSFTCLELLEFLTESTDF